MLVPYRLDKQRSHVDSSQTSVTKAITDCKGIYRCNYSYDFASVALAFCQINNLSYELW
jgi:hypothetical protein